MGIFSSRIGIKGRKKADPQVGFSDQTLNYFEAEPEAAAGAIEAAGAEAAIEPAAIEPAAIEAAGAEASIEPEAAGAAIEAAGAEASIEAAGAAGAIGAEASIEAEAGADIDASSFLPHATRATANRETINRDFFMGFSLNNSKKF